MRMAKTAEVMSTRQLAGILFMMRTTVVISFVPLITTGSAAQDAWAAGLIAGLLLTLAAWVVAGLAARYPKLTVIDYSRMLLGRFFGTVVSLAISWHFLLIAATDIRIYAELMRVAFMPNTPIWFTTLAMVFLASLAAWFGIEPIGRAAEAFLPFFVAFIALTLLGAAPSVNVQNLQPALARGPGPIFSSVWTPLGIGLQWVSVGMLFPQLTPKDQRVRSAVVAAAVSSAVLAVVAAVLVGVLGASLSSKSLFPFLKMARSVRPTRTIERIEILGTVAWGLGLFAGGATMVYCGSRAMAQILRIQESRKVVPAFGALVALYAMYAYKDAFELVGFFRPPGFPLLIALTAGVPYALMWASHVARHLVRRHFGRQGR